MKCRPLRMTAQIKRIWTLMIKMQMMGVCIFRKCFRPYLTSRIDEDDYVDYDSDYDAKAEQGRAPASAVDPYAG